MSPIRGQAAGAVDRVNLWTAFYTRGLPSEIAQSRQSEMESDLHEQLSFFAHHGKSDRDIARSVQTRALRGAMADLVWRHGQLRTAASVAKPAGAIGWYPNALLGISWVLGMAMFVWGIYVVARWGSRISRAPYLLGSRDLFLVTIATAICVCGLLMLRRARTRWIGALWLAACVYVLVDRGLAILTPISASASFAEDLLPGLFALEISASAGIMLFFVGVALWWAPSLRAANKTGTSPA